MSLAIFDLDNTLIRGDSDHSFGEYLADEGLVDADEFREQNDLFYQQYLQGTLDIFEYSQFALKTLVGKSTDELSFIQKDFFAKKIEKMYLPKAQELIDSHRDQGDDLLIITATNRFVTAPIAQWLGITELLATEPEVINGAYTGKVVGIPCFQDGKVKRLNEWLKSYNGDLNNSCFYSDSFNDIPLLEIVDTPVAVDPDDKLRKHAENNHWKILSLR
ncbi:HAD family hydrolase [Sessilibacter corallicola]|uniref:HAD family hydrolase n=1 Tax=Sessilibacter corallicola TaxID=2904075 RepID=A0ABQ0A8F2_9GAMM|nr:HAD family hydrolase [Sessilibacter corallicola]MCE2030403.1 HAD-IB family hydrolase [Sessilibacter corallicola]